MSSIDIIKVLTAAILSFGVGIAITPIITHFLYKYRVWKQVGGKKTLDGKEAVEFNKLHGELETKTPRMGGIVIWASVFMVSLGIWALARLLGGNLERMDFISRSQTWVPLFALFVGATVGFISDLFDVSFDGKDLNIRWRLFIVSVLALFLGYWFYVKLGIDAISIPFDGYLYLGWLIIPFFIILSIFLYASGIIDGIDGLSGGVFMFIFIAYSMIAFMQHQIDLAAFSAAVAGALGAFLWFNVPPARFYMTETGSMPMTLTIATLAVMTDKLGGGIGISVLPVIAFLLFVTVLSTVAQVASKKFFGRKLFKIAPIHHHFEAVGWPSYKVTMRYWLLGIMFAIIGVLLSLLA